MVNKKEKVGVIFNRTFTICPYLVESPKGIVCKAENDFIRNIEDINSDYCISRYFELCHLYISKLDEIDTTKAFAKKAGIR
jgi:hypothetical protein